MQFFFLDLAKLKGWGMKRKKIYENWQERKKESPKAKCDEGKIAKKFHHFL